ncbi:hypothetical protein DPMN_026688 [Dreissena polymorpha]|uniref:Uncharacterized protein n=1 Tax=Dreissena polymorpha TaxID=45954 RepID=A0A9D4RDR6_DREPO|nr:hypothetical protein DPMN_026688 [Dreissena polymorpha]
MCINKKTALPLSQQSYGTKHGIFRVLTRKDAPPHEICPAPFGHVFQQTGTILKLVQYFIGTHGLTKILEDCTNMKNDPPYAAIVLTRKYALPPSAMFYYGRSHIFQRTRNIFKLIRTIFLTKCLENWTKMKYVLKNAPSNGEHVCQHTKTIFECIKLS